MHQALRVSITRQMHLAYNAITNVESNNELISALQIHGFPQSMIDQGETVYEAATLAVSSEIIAEEELCENVKLSDGLQKQIREIYSLFSDTAAKCFGKDALEMLGLRTGKPRSSRAYCETLKLCIDKLYSYPELKQRIQTKGFDQNQIQYAFKITTDYENAIDQLIKQEKILENASKKRNTAIFTLKTWLSSFAEAFIAASECKPYLIKQLGIEKKELYDLAQINFRRSSKTVSVQ
ncbi:MAG TPA: hypothetical protein VHP36_08445 [Chitinispirillaceae bacterium]|nr:hypothetical protein [Chitinispirillaceae bacterium]